jgi:hypothetical protein
VVVRLTGGDFWCLESSADLSSSTSLRPRAACVMLNQWSKLKILVEYELNAARLFSVC